MVKVKILKSCIFPLLLVLYELSTYFSNDGYLPAVPNIMKDLSATQQSVLLTITIWYIAPALLQLIIGPLADSYGRRKVLLIGGVVFTLSSLLCAITSSLSVLCLARLFQGATVASMTIAGYATLHELYDHQKAVQALAWMYSVTLTGTAFGPLLGVLILHYTSWRWIFIFIAIWVSAIITALYFLMPETITHIQKLNTKQVFLNYKNILKNITYLKATLSFCFLFSALIGWITVGPFYVIIKSQYTQFQFGIVQAFVFGSYVIGAQSINILMKRFPLEYLAKIGLSIGLLAGILILIAPYICPGNLLSILIPIMVIMGATGFCAPVLNRISIDASEEPMGARMAMFYSLVSCFGLLGSSLISLFYKGSPYSFTCLLFLFTLFAFISFTIPQRIKITNKFDNEISIR